MADNNLKVVIDVTAPGAKETFDDVAKASAKVNDSLKQLGQQGVLNVRSINDAIGKLKTVIAETSDPKELQKLNIALAALQNKAKDVPQSFENISKGVEKVHVSSLRASSSALNLSKTLGILPAESAHISHGVESLIHAFEEMQGQSVNSGEALKKLAGTLAGGLGIGIAITLLSSLVEEFFKTEDGVDQSALALERFKDNLNDLSDSLKNFKADRDFLDKINHLRDELGGKSGTELDILDLKRSQASNEQILRVLRNDFIKINTEIDKAVKLAATFGISLSSVAPIEQAIIDKMSDTNKALAAGFNELIKKRKEVSDQIIGAKQEELIKPLETQIAINKKRKEDYEKYLAQLEKDIAFEEGLFKGLTEAIKAIGSDLEKTINKDQEIRLGVIIDINKDTLATNFGEKEQQISSQLQKEVKRLTESNPILIRANAKVEITADEKALQDSLKNINNILQQALTDSLIAFGEGLGEALSGGDIEKAFKGFAGVVGGAVKAIGEQLIALGTAALAAKVALQGLFKNPALQIAAGIALVAIGSAMQNLLNGGVKGFAEGGFTGAGGRQEAAGIVHKGEFVVPAHAVSKLGVGFLSNLAFGGFRGFESGGFVGSPVSGGGITLKIVGTNVIRGQDIIQIFAATSRSQNRNF